MTSWIEGVGTFAPAGTGSNRDKAYERAAVHPNMEHHLRISAACARPLSSSDMPRTFPEAKLRKKWAVSSENLPPTSPPSTTTLALPSAPTSSG